MNKIIIYCIATCVVLAIITALSMRINLSVSFSAVALIFLGALYKNEKT